jgi:Mrp family chromosome partitioning ATPase
MVSIEGAVPLPERSHALAQPATAEEAAGTYIQALVRYWPVVAGTVVLSVAIALFTLSRSGDTYQASASVLVSPLGASDPTFTGTGVVIDTGDPARTVQTAAALLNSPRAASLAASALGGGWTEGGVRGAVSVTPRGQSNVLAVTARASTPEDASNLANAFAHAAVQARTEIVQQNIAAKLRALDARFRQPGAIATATGQQELALRIVQLEAVRATKADPTLQVAQDAEPPSGSTGLPRLLLVVLSAIVGFAIGSVGAVALSYFSPKVGDESEVAALLPLPVLATIPKVSILQRRHGMHPTSLPPFVFEQIRKIRAQIPPAQGSSAIMVTSAASGDGKTTIAAGLASAFAEGGEDVILLDLDLRRPGVADLFGLEPSGTRSLQGESFSLAHMLVSVPGLPHIKVLSSRRASISVLERLVSNLPALLSEARGLAKWIILDTPPLGEVSDGLRFAPDCDGVVVVVRARHTDRSRLILAYNQLMRVGARVLGTVVNDQRRTVNVRKRTHAYHGVAWEVVEEPDYRRRWAAPADSRSNVRASSAE